jgi:hypothetical protein
MKKRVVKKIPNKKLSFKSKIAIFLIYLVIIVFLLTSAWNFTSIVSEKNGYSFDELNSLSFTEKVFLGLRTVSMYDKFINLSREEQYLIGGVLIVFITTIIIIITRSHKEKVVNLEFDANRLLKEFRKNGYTDDVIEKIFRRKGVDERDIKDLLKITVQN